MAERAWQFHPVTPDRWHDLETLFGKRGACGGCWCMYWRLSHSGFAAGKGEGNRRAMRKLVQKGPPPGLLAYDAGRPVGWCALAPREQYQRLGTSRILKPVDQEPVWSITCFFVERPSRDKGLTVALLKAAAAYVSSLGGGLLEGYPVDTSGKKAPAVFVYTGLLPAFLKAGFTEVARRSPTRPIVRKLVKG